MANRKKVPGNVPADSKRSQREATDSPVPSSPANDLGADAQWRTEVAENIRKIEHLGSFVTAGMPPVITDVEVIVCFCDIRGFTQYVHQLQHESQDNKVHGFIRDYFRIYTHAVLNTLDLIDRFGDIQDSLRSMLRRHAVPASYKHLGDGMMLVWEVPSAPDPKFPGTFTHCVFLLIQEINSLFIKMTRNLSPVAIDTYSHKVSDLSMGFGLTKGHAWKMSFGDLKPCDYAGSVINLAARLQDIARPRGIVASTATSEWFFRNLAEKNRGRIISVPVRGIKSDSVEVWVSPEVVPPTNDLSSNRLDSQSGGPVVPSQS